LRINVPNTGSVVELSSKFGAPSQIASVFAPTCDALDVVSVAEDLPINLELGDLLYSDNIGAYTTASATSFNGMPPAKVIAVGAKDLPDGRRPARGSTLRFAKRRSRCPTHSRT
jgi:hypothetical protein